MCPFQGLEEEGRECQVTLYSTTERNDDCGMEEGGYEQISHVYEFQGLRENMKWSSFNHMKELRKVGG